MEKVTFLESEITFEPAYRFPSFHVNTPAPWGSPLSHSPSYLRPFVNVNTPQPTGRPFSKRPSCVDPSGNMYFPVPTGVPQPPIAGLVHSPSHDSTDGFPQTSASARKNFKTITRKRRVFVIYIKFMHKVYNASSPKTIFDQFGKTCDTEFKLKRPRLQLCKAKNLKFSVRPVSVPGSPAGPTDSTEPRRTASARPRPLRHRPRART